MQRAIFNRSKISLSLNKPSAALLYTPVYYQIRQARQEEDPSLSQGIWEHELKKADWALVEKICAAALLHESKDLQLVAWLTESWIALDGWQGLADGLSLLNDFCRNLWDEMLPEISAQEHRWHIFDWINREFTTRLYQVPLWPGEHFTLQNVGQETPAFENLLPKGWDKQFQIISGNLQKLEKFLESKILGVRFKELNRTINDWNGILRKVAETPRVGKQELTTVTAEPPSSSSMLAAPEEDPKVSMNRHQAYEAIERIAQYLEAIEPHSPTHSVLRKVVSWEEQSLAQILSDFDVKGDSMSMVLSFLGVRE